MLAGLRSFFERLVASGYPAHVFTVAGFVLAFFLVARLMNERRAPANTLAWLLGIVLIPWVGVPLYLIFGGRKLRRLARLKSRLVPTLPGSVGTVAPHPAGPVAAAVTAAGGSPPLGGNRLRPLTTGEEEFAELERRILAARRSIHVTTFILGPDETGRRVVGLLAQRAREGVKVRLLLDALGCLRTRGHFVRPLIEAGGEVGRFMPMLPLTFRTSANLRNHRKLAVFDHTAAILGGRNLAREYMGPRPYRKRWRDFGVTIEGPAAALLNEVFIADWCFATRQPPEALHAEIPPEAAAPRGTAGLQVVASGPDVPGDPIYEGILAMIQEAEESVWIVTPYFIPDDVLLRSLIVKARAGRDVTVVMPARSNHPVADLARRQSVRDLAQAGARLLLFPDGMLHAKALIVDERTALVGSANLDLRSLFVNFEIGMLVHSPPEVAAIKAWARGLVRVCQPVKADRPRSYRILSDIAEDISRLLAPLL